MAVTETGHLASREIDDLYRAHGGEVYRYAFAVLGNHADAEDVTQTTFLNAYRALEQGVRPRKPSNWLLTIASNAIKQRFRQEQARPRQVELDERIPHASPSDDERRPERRRASHRAVEDPATATPGDRPARVRGPLVRRDRRDPGRHDLRARDAPLPRPPLACRRARAPAHLHRGAAGGVPFGRRPARAKGARRLRDHLAECPDCARFARMQKRHSSALRGLALVPDPALPDAVQGTRGDGLRCCRADRRRKRRSWCRRSRCGRRHERDGRGNLGRHPRRRARPQGRSSGGGGGRRRERRRRRLRRDRLEAESIEASCRPGRAGSSVSARLHRAACPCRATASRVASRAPRDRRRPSRTGVPDAPGREAGERTEPKTKAKARREGKA